MVETLSSLGNFGLYMLVSLAALVVFKYVYTLVTPQDEWKLILKDENTAAAIAFGGAIVGFSIALAGAASNSVGLIDYVIWAAVALLAQVIAFGLTRLTISDVVSRIESGSVPSAVILAAISIGVGVLNAACLTY